jgi:hypothetical protein
MNLKLFNKSAEFEKHLLSLIDLPLLDSSKKLLLSDASCAISLEHWTVCRDILQAGMLPSGAVIHRAQFEALLRAMWILYAASDEHLGKLDVVLTIEAECGAKNLPQTNDMMLSLQKKAPSNAYDALNRFKENSWKALNSYVHAGIHPLTNGLAVMSAMHTAILNGVQPMQKEILSLANEYSEYMPQPL